MLKLRRNSAVGHRSGVGERSARIRLQKNIFVASLVCLLVVTGVAAWPFTRAHLQAVAILRIVSGQPVPWIIRKLVTEPIRTEDVNFATNAGVVRGRLYLPGGHPDAPGLVILHGVHHLGIDEPRLENFARAMAGCGLRVLTPELPGIKDYHVDLGSVRVIGESARWFSEQTRGPVGVLGLSFSGGLALVAAADPMYTRDFKFVMAVGSQDEMAHVANYLTGQETRPDGTLEVLKPHEYGPLVLEYEHLEDFVPTKDEAAIRPVLREHLYEEKTAETLALAKLNQQQRTEAEQLIDSDSPLTKSKLAASDLRHAPEMEQLSPHEKLRTMTTTVYLLHGQADNIIPAAETLWMQSELPRTALQAALVTPVLSHVNLDGAKPGASDLLRLVHFFALVMHTAERK
jgi:dienelactone hydrolase